MIHFLPSFSATAPVVPLPAKKSAIIEFLFDDAFIILSSSLIGF